MTSPSTTTTVPRPTRWHQLLPPRFVLLLTIAMIATRWIPASNPFTSPWNLLGLPVLLGGIVLNLTNAVRFAREQTNIVTFGDPTLLLTNGWFARTRNPMYVGFALMLIGTAVLVGTLAAWLGPIAFIAVSNWWYIPFEEGRLAATFGDDYDNYRRRVRRWL